MINEPVIYYKKKSNLELFKKFEKEPFEFIHSQNYNPILPRLFLMNDTNYNKITLNYDWHVEEILEKITENKYKCILKHTDKNIPPKTEIIYVKFVPLYDPEKFICEKNKNITDLKNMTNYLKLPTYDQEKIKIFDSKNHMFPNYEDEPELKIWCPNNKAYIDSFFIYLSNLLYKKGFIHGIDFFGSFLGYKKNFQYNIAEDFEMLNQNQNFHKNMNSLFFMNDIDHLLYKLQNKKQLLISSKSTTLKSSIFDDFIDYDYDNHNDISFNTLSYTPITSNNETSNLYKELHMIDYNNNDYNVPPIFDMNTTDYKSTSSIISKSSSSKSSYTSILSNKYTHNKSDDNCLVNYDDDNSNDNDDNSNSNDDESDYDDNSSISDSTNENTDWKTVTTTSINSSDINTDTTDSELENIFISIPLYPVQSIFIETYKDTLDKLIYSGELDTEEKWLAMLLQIIMTLLVYQKIFNFTHNDLHVDNIMYIETQKQYIFYKYKKVIYRVPTYGKIFKIIDFGRAIYDLNDEIYCSDDFNPKGNAATQYNMPPFFNNKKEKIERNFSFDLTRLACSIFDYVFTDDDDYCNADTLCNCDDPIKRIIGEWCLDDKGKNVLYKSSGDERYVDFKLYKMISRIVHNHTPENQLCRQEFKNFIFSNYKAKKDKKNLVDIDQLITDFSFKSFSNNTI